MIDLSDMGIEEAESGGQISVPGWYRCVLEDASPDPKNDSVWLFVFKVAHGPWKGAAVYDRLYDPDLAEDAQKAATSKKRQALYAHRLGLWSGVKGEQMTGEWPDAIGREVVLQVKVEAYTDKQGQQKQSPKVEFNGIFPLDDARIPEGQRHALGLAVTVPPAATKKAGSPTLTEKMAAKEGGAEARPAAAAPLTPGAAGKPRRNWGAL